MTAVRRRIAASPDAVWAVLSDPATWPVWGPVMADIETPATTVREGMRGHVLFVPGIRLPFEVTDVQDHGRVRSWTWRVGHLPGVVHSVEPDPRRPGGSVVSFDAPAWYPGHLIISRGALHHLDRLLVPLDCPDGSA